MARDLFPAEQVVSAQTPRVFELRTYVVPDNASWTCCTRGSATTPCEFFPTSWHDDVWYGKPMDQPASGTTMVYMLAHASREAAKKSWDAFRADQEWAAVAKESGVGPVKIEAVYMEPDRLLAAEIVCQRVGSLAQCLPARRARAAGRYTRRKVVGAGRSRRVLRILAVGAGVLMVCSAAALAHSGADAISSTLRSASPRTSFPIATSSSAASCTRRCAREPSGGGWRTDYPYGEINLTIRLSELTKTPVSRDGGRRAQPLRGAR